MLTADKLRILLKDLANELNKLRKRSSPNFEIYVVGGAAMILEHELRDSTVDIDAVWSSDLIKECVHRVADKNGVSDKWCNFDFKHTASYTPAIMQNCKEWFAYRGLTVYTANLDLLFCMKLIAGRDKDLPDLRKIVQTLQNQGTQIDRTIIDEWLNRYYTRHGKNVEISELGVAFLNDMFNKG